MRNHFSNAFVVTCFYKIYFVKYGSLITNFLHRSAPHIHDAWAFASSLVPCAFGPYASQCALCVLKLRYCIHMTWFSLEKVHATTSPQKNWFLLIPPGTLPGLEFQKIVPFEHIDKPQLQIVGFLCNILYLPWLSSTAKIASWSSTQIFVVACWNVSAHMQVEYYFSDENLPNDKFLLKQMKKDKAGFGKCFNHWWPLPPTRFLYVWALTCTYACAYGGINFSKIDQD